MVLLELKPGTAGLKAHMNPLSYGSTPVIFKLRKPLVGVAIRLNGKEGGQVEERG